VLASDDVVEQGEAAPMGADWWELAPQAVGGRVIVKARDLAGNVAEMEGWNIENSRRFSLIPRECPR